MEYLPGIICLLGMVVFMMMGIPIVYSLGVVSLVVGLIFFGVPCLEEMGRTTFTFLFRQAILPLPLFLLLASIIAETRMGDDLFNAGSKWLSGIPGGLVAGSIVGEGGMAAVMGHSAGTVIAVGKIAVPQFKKYGYHRGYSLGGLVCGGVLGPLIPPSGLMIIYTLFANASLGRLFIAGIIPGIILAIMLAGTAITMAVRNPQLGPAGAGASWRERFASLKRVIFVIVLMLGILGTIYLGIATPTEAAGIGCALALIIAAAVYQFRLPNLLRAMKDGATITGMIVFIMVSATFFSYVVASSGIGSLLADSIVALDVPPIVFILALNVMYILFGFFIDTLAMIMITLPIFIPAVSALGFDLVWFGVLICVNMEIGAITPPMGINLYALRNVFNIPAGELIRGVIPFLIVLIVFLGILVVFPDLCLWLPSLMMK